MIGEGIDFHFSLTPCGHTLLGNTTRLSAWSSGSGIEVVANLGHLAALFVEQTLNIWVQGSLSIHFKIVICKLICMRSLIPKLNLITLVSVDLLFSSKFFLTLMSSVILKTFPAHVTPELIIVEETVLEGTVRIGVEPLLLHHLLHHRYLLFKPPCVLSLILQVVLRSGQFLFQSSLIQRWSLMLLQLLCNLVNL